MVAFGGSAVAYVVSATALFVLAGNFRPHRARTKLGADIREGITFLRHHRLLSSLALVTGVVGFAGSATSAIFVLYAVGPMGLSGFGFGVVTSAAAVGGLAGSALAQRTRRRLGSRNSLLLSVGGFATFSATVALTDNIWLVGAALAISGAGAMVWNVVVVSIRQELAPEDLIGRVTSAYRLLGRDGRPLGALAGGLFGEAAGLRPVFAASALVLLLCLLPLRHLTFPTHPSASAEPGAREPSDHVPLRGGSSDRLSAMLGSLCGW